MSTLVPLQRVIIENFRGIRELTMELDPRVTVLFGSYAAGKTSILDAIAIALAEIVARVPDAARLEFARSDIRRPRKTRRAPWDPRRSSRSPWIRSQARFPVAPRLRGELSPSGTESVPERANEARP